ncbi:MAG: glucosylglycerol hydrolase, partial [Cyanobacteria bacterium P01_A01_bin.40]
KVNGLKAKFNLTTREFRHQHPWLAQNMLSEDMFDKIMVGESTIVYGMRANSHQDIALVANFEGDAVKLDLSEILGIKVAEWDLAIATPNLEVKDFAKLSLGNSQGILLTRSKT